MKLKYACILALMLVFVVYNTHTLYTIQEPGRERVTIERAIDGDTVKTDDGRTLRLVNINAPEKDSPLSAQAIAFMKTYENKQLDIEVIGTDKYHRLLARVYDGPIYLNLKLVQEGLASIFLVQDDERKAFSQAEQQAVEESKGIWQHAPAYKCISLKVDKQAEKVELECTCYTGSITGWYLKDESRKTYKFQGICTSDTLWSASGTDTEHDRYWNAGNVWNNDRDTAYLFTAQHELVARTSYGYPR